jgi:hypothetical protein
MVRRQLVLKQSVDIDYSKPSVDNSIKIQPVLRAYFACIRTACIQARTYGNLTLVICTGRILIQPVLQAQHTCIKT